MTNLRQLHLRGALGTVRTEMWDGREHLVVPVVALQEAVIHAVNAKNAEYVPASSLTASVGKWNGHPLVVGHPVKNGKQISAHSPEVLAAHGFGFIRSSTMNGTRLGMEAMVDVSRLEALKHNQLLADLRAGKSIEVSVGAFVNTNDKTGSHGGKNYNGEWTEITPDHLAFLPGGVGACSMAMGCGAHRAAMHLVTAEGFEVEMVKPRSLKERFAALTNALKSAGLYDTPEQLASEEAAESIGYATIRELLDQVGDSWDAADDLVDELIAAEENPAADEEAETEIERARLEAIRVLCMAMYGHLNSIMSTTMPKVDVPRYMEEFRAAYGKTISAKTMKTVQSAHDASHDMHSHTVALGAACNGMRLLGDLPGHDFHGNQYGEGSGGSKSDVERRSHDGYGGTPTPVEGDRVKIMGKVQGEGKKGKVGSGDRDGSFVYVKDDNGGSLGSFHVSDLKVLAGNERVLSRRQVEALASKDCPTCHGTGQVKTDGKQADCEACDGEGVMKTAAAITPELKAAECGCKETNVNKTERIAALLKNEYNPIKDVRVLEAASDDVIGIFETQATANAKQAADLKAANDAEAKAKADLKAASEHVPTEEEYIQAAPESIRTLVAEKKAQDAAQRSTLIASLKTAQKVYTEERLNAMPLAQLQEVAALAKIETPVDYSGRAFPAPRAAEGAEDYTPPDPYAAGLKALQSKTVN